MSQSPLARSTRRTLPAFAHTPSRLSKSTSSHELASPQTPEEQNGYRTPTKHEGSGMKSRGTSSTPQTPKIYYSPYATASPHAGPSRSASIPFDMAANAKAGRQAEEERRLREATPTPAVKKKRLIRRKPFLQRAQEWPQRIVDRIIFDAPTSVQDVIPPAHLAGPIAVALYCIHYLLLAPLFFARDLPDSVLRATPEPTGVRGRYGDLDQAHRGKGLVGKWTALSVTMVLILISLANSAYLFTRFRTYDMQLRSAQDPVPSPHASPISSPKASKQEQEGDTFSPSESSNTKGRVVLRFAQSSLKFMFRTIIAGIRAAFGKPSETSSAKGYAATDDRIQSLRVWEPPEFCLSLFCFMPPSAPALTYILAARNPLLLPFLHLITIFLLSHLATSYTQLVKDRMLLTAEVMKEYDQRFVYKKVFASRVDRSVQTNEAESLW